MTGNTKTQTILVSFNNDKFRYTDAVIAGAFSGVICVASWAGGEDVLWNPATGEEKWDEKNNNVVDFKLLVTQGPRTIGEAIHSAASHQPLIYSLCSNSWRLIKDPQFLINNIGYVHPGGGVYLNGVLLWLVLTLNEGRIGYSYILTFEAATESFRKIMLPVAETLGHILNSLTLAYEISVLS
ncbi:hypothetical protein QQ045_027072 [Rhodiola kirilowii]